MEAIKTIQELMDVPASYKQVFQNTFTNSIDKTKIVTAKCNNAIGDKDVRIAEFLFTYRFATLDQIYKWLELKNDLDEVETKDLLKVRLEKLVKMYKILNKFVLSPYDADGFNGENLEFYCLDLGGAFLLHNFTNQTLENIMNWRPKNANYHTPDAVSRDIMILDIYLRMLDIFGDELKYFDPYKRMSYNKRQTTVTFDFCVERDGDIKYFIGEIVKYVDLRQRFPQSSDSLEQILSTNTWKKYYLDVQEQPVVLYFVDDDEDALKIADSLSLREIPKFRITTKERMQGDLSTAFMAYDPENKALKLGRYKLFEKR